MAFDHLVLRITDTCPLQCAHCCVESGPWRTTAMDVADGIACIRQAHAMNPNTVVSFTGGEPFVRYPLLRDLMREAHALGLISTVVTSAVWCKSEAFARERLAELQALGLRAISVSLDSFHEPWATADHVERCLSAAVSLGLKAACGGAITRTSRGARELLGERAERFPMVEFGDAPVAPTGRGALIPLESLFVNDWSAENPVCPMTTDLYIEPDGGVLPCCSSGGDPAFLRLGNARETPLADLRQRLDRSLWFRLIAGQGFAGLEATVRRFDPEFELPKHYVNVCHLCQLTFQDNDTGRRVRAALVQAEAREAAAASVLTGLWAQLRAALAGATRE